MTLAFIGEIIASWQPRPAADPTEAAGLLSQIAGLVPLLVINRQDGADLFDEDELACWGRCDRTLRNFIRYPESPDYLRGYLSAC
jgi:predicted metal-binding protein